MPGLKPEPGPPCRITAGLAPGVPARSQYSSWPSPTASRGMRLEHPPVADHRAVRHVAVRLRTQALDPLTVIRARERLVVADDVAPRDPEARHQPARQPQRCPQLLAVPHHHRVARADVLDADRRPVQPDGVAADVAQRNDPADVAAAVDDVVRADAGQLVEL